MDNVIFAGYVVCTIEKNDKEYAVIDLDELRKTAFCETGFDVPLDTLPYLVWYLPVDELYMSAYCLAEAIMIDYSER